MTHIGGGRIYWFATATEPLEAASGAKSDLLRRPGTWHPPVAALIEATDGDSIIRTDIFDRSPAHWGRGGVTPATPPT
jgi:hypothetical protein